MLPFFRPIQPYDSYTITLDAKQLTEDILCRGLYITSKGAVIDYNYKTGRMTRIEDLEGTLSEFYLDDTEQKYTYTITTDNNIVYKFTHKKEEFLAGYWYRPSKSRQGIIQALLDDLD